MNTEYDELRIVLAKWMAHHKYVASLKKADMFEVAIYLVSEARR